MAKPKPSLTQADVTTALNACAARFPGWTTGRVLLHLFTPARLLSASNDELIAALNEAAPVLPPRLDGPEEGDPMKRTKR